MALQVNDELVYDCHKKEEAKLRTIVKEIMENVCELKVPLKVDIEEGNDWYQAK